MSKQYEIGYYYERKVKQILEKDSCLVWWSSASIDNVDVEIWALLRNKLEKYNKKDILAML